MTHKTKGIVLRCIKYGETSIVTTLYTELFGLQAYIVKGARQQSKKSAGKANYFQAAAILQMEVYQNNLKNLQFIKEYQWEHLYQKIYFDVARNASAMYVTELILRSIKQPEANAELFHLMEESLLQIDKATDTIAANVPLYFTLQLASLLGFQLQGAYSKTNAVLDLREGVFLSEQPLHPQYISGEAAKICSQLNEIKNINELENIKMNKNMRRQLLDVCQQYFALHITDFGEMKSLKILYEIFN